jgi:hypothetical protein
MYKCKNCKALFKEPKKAEEGHPYGMSYAMERWSVCPHCEGKNFMEIKEPKEIEPFEVLEMLVYLCAAYNLKSSDRCNCLEYAVDRVRKFISETLNDEDLYTDLKNCKTSNSTQQIINFIFESFKEKE